MKNMFKKKHFLILQIILTILVLLTNLVSADDITDPSLNFVNPTPDDGHYQTERNVTINVSITEENLEELNYNWNGTNYTMYSDSLVLMMNFDDVSSLGESNTNYVDMSTYGNDGTASNFDNDENVAGKYGSSVSFDSGDYISIPNDASLNFGTGDFTVSFWFKISSTPSTTYQMLCKRVAGGGNYELQLSSGYIYVYIEGSGQNTLNFQSQSQVPTNEWTYVSLVRNNGYAYLYMNGAEQGSGQSNHDVDSTSALTLAMDSDNEDEFYTGHIDELRIWNTGLSEQEIYQQYVSNLKKLDSDSWRFYINQSKDTTTDLDDGIYTYQAFATDTSNNQAHTEQRTIGINMDPSPPVPEKSTLILIGFGMIALISYVVYTKKK